MMPAGSTRKEFAAEVSRPEPDVDLARAALLVAREEYPQLPVERYLNRLDILAEEVKDRLANESAPLVVLQELLATLYERHSFRGNQEAYYDPRNSFLNEVLDRGLGIPLTLGIVVLEVGWRLGLPLEGVSFPMHFLVRFPGDAVRLLVDPFDAGQVRFEDGAQQLLDRVYGGTVRLRTSFLRTATRREMLVRLLTNLKRIYVQAGDDARALAAVERMLLIDSRLTVEMRARGMLLARLGRHDEAVEQLEDYLTYAPQAADAERIREVVQDLRLGRARGEGHEHG